ncbi:unnamed protein product [Ixodes hexagonus]
MAQEPAVEELRAMLVDERHSSLQHRSNLDKLKAAHVSLQEDYVKLQKDLRDALQSIQEVRANHANILQRADKVITQKDALIKELRVQLSSTNREKLRREIEEEVRSNFAEYVRQQQLNHEKSRLSLHEANRENAVLKAQLENERRIHQRSEEELKLKQKAEINRLQVELQRFQSQENSTDAREVLSRLLKLQREHADLQLKMKNVSAESKDAKRDKDAVIAEQKAISQRHAEEMAAAEDSCRNLEAKLRSAQSQRDAFDQTVCKFRQEVGSLSLQLSALEEEKLKLKGQLADVEQRHKAELLQLKLDTVKQRAELETTHRKAMTELTNAKLDAELALKAANEHKRTAAEKETEAERRHQLTRTKDWDRARRLESEKVLLEAQLSEAATAKAAADQRLMDAEKQMRRLKQAQENQRQDLEEEMQALRTRLKASLAVREDTNKMAAENHVLRQKLQLLEEERTKDRAAIEGTAQQKDGLSETVERLKSQLQGAQVDAIKTNEENQKVCMQMKLSWEQEKYDYVKRIEELESDIRQAHKEFNWKLRSLKQKNKQCQRTVSTYHAKIKDLKSANRQIESEVLQLRQNVPLNTHNQLQHELKKLRRKQQEFRSLLEFSPPLKEDKSLGTNDLAATTKKQSFWNFLEVKKKLDHLDAQQQKQMNQLATLVNRLPMMPQESSPSNVSSCSSMKQSAESESSSESESTKKSQASETCVKV